MVHIKRQDMLVAESILKILMKEMVSKVNRAPSIYLISQVYIIRGARFYL